MQKRFGRINWAFLVVVLFALAAGTLTVGGLWYWNKHLRAQRGLERGLAAYEKKDWDVAAVYLGQYLAAIQPKQDTAILIKYAEAQMNRRPLTKGYIEQALRAYHQILRLEDNPDVSRRLIEFYVRTDPAEAQRMAEAFLERQDNPEIACYAAQAMMQRGQMIPARQKLQQVLERYPDCLQAYLLMVRLAQQDPDLSDKTPLEWLNAAVEANSSEPSAYLYRAQYHLQNLRTDEAQADIEKAKTLPLQTRQQKLQLASVYLTAGRLEEAERLLSSLQSEQADDLSVWLLWAQWAVRSGRTEGMVRVAQEGMAALQPDPYDFLITAAELFIQARRWDQAESIIRLMTERKDESETIAYLQGLLAQTKGDWPTALTIWRKLSASSTAPDASIRLAQALMEAGDPLAAVQQLRGLLLRFPEHAEAHALLARWSLKEGRLVEAADHIQKALRKQPDNQDYRRIWLTVRFRQMQTSQNPPDQAEQARLIQESQEMARRDPSFLAEQISFWIETGRLEEAQAQLEHLKKQEGPTIRVRLLESDLFRRQGQYRQARQILEELRRDYPASLEPIQKWVVFAVQTGEYEQAAAFLDAISPESFSAEQQKVLAVWRAEVLFLKGQVQEAAAVLADLAKQYPADIPLRRRLLEWTRRTAEPEQLRRWIEDIKNAEGEQGRQWRYEQARLLFERGQIRRDYPQIVSLLNAVLRSYPEDIDSRILLASVYEASGNLALAVQEYQNALAKDMDNLELIASAVAAMYRAQEYRAAEMVLQQAARRGLRDPRLTHLEVQRLLQQGRFGTAAEILQDMIAKNPNDQNLKLSLALMHLYQNQLSEAEQILHLLQEAEPFSLPVIAARVELAMRRKETDQAVQICDAALTARPSEPRLYALRAMVRTQIGLTEQAQGDIKTMLRLSESSRDSFLLAADLFMNLNQTDAAVETMEEALRLYPEDLAVLRKAVLIYARAPQQRKVIEALVEKYLAAEPKDPTVLLLKAQMLLSENTAAAADEGERILHSLLNDYPRIEGGWAALTEWYMRNGQTGRALDSLLKGLEFFPESSILLLMKARLEAMRGGHLALPTLQDLYKRFPNDERVAALYAELCIRTGRFQEAESVLESRRETQEKGNSAFRILTLHFLHQTGRREQAWQLFEKELKESPEPSHVFYRWAVLLIKDQQRTALQELLEKYSEYSPACLDAAARICLQMGLDEDPKGRETVAECLRLLLERRPNHPQLMLSLAKLYHFWQQYKPAEQLYRALLTQNSLTEETDRAAAMNNLAWILFSQNKQLQEALQWADKGLMIQPQNADLLDTRGEIFFEMGQFAKAREDFEQSLKNAPPYSPERVKTGYRLVKTFLAMNEKQQAARWAPEVWRWNQSNPVLNKDQMEELQDLFGQ